MRQLFHPYMNHHNYYKHLVYIHQIHKLLHKLFFHNHDQKLHNQYFLVLFCLQRYLFFTKFPRFLAVKSQNSMVFRL